MSPRQQSPWRRIIISACATLFLVFLNSSTMTPYRAVAQEAAPEINITEGCMSTQCHGSMLTKPKVHGAVKFEQCEACHAPVDDRHEFEPPPDPPDVCWECHDAFPEDEQWHGIVEAGECLACHDPHGSLARQLIVTRTVVELCTSCHENPADGLAAKHGPAASGDCLGCHVPHTAKHQHLLRQSGADLCLSCHNRRIRRDDRTYVPDIAALIEKKANIHSPAEDCLLCHGAHGGISEPNLIENFPRANYAPFAEDTYALCFQCHDSALAADAESTDTGFRNGTRNLHYVHVNKDKGRSCLLCHNPHATDLPHMLREQVDFGGQADWSFELRYEETPTGGGCWPGCHRKLTYDREKPVQAALRTLVTGHVAG